MEDVQPSEEQPGPSSRGEESGVLAKLKAKMESLETSFAGKIHSLQTDLAHTKQTYSTALTKVVKRMKRLEEKIQRMKARRKANIIDLETESDHDEEEQGRNILEDLNQEGFETHSETQVPPHPDLKGRTTDAQKKSSDTQESTRVQDQVEFWDAAKFLAESAKKKAPPEVKEFYSRKTKKNDDSTPKKGDTASKDSGTATIKKEFVEVTPRRKGKEKMVEQEIETPKRTRLQKAQEAAGLAEAIRLQELEDEEAQRRAEQERLDFEAAMEYQSYESPVRDVEVNWEDPKLQEFLIKKNRPKPITVA